MIAIQPIQPHQIEQAKQIVIAVSLEIWDGVFTEEDLKCYSMADIEDVQSHYFEKRGIFLVLMDGEQVVGTGAIRNLEEDICELKRMWFLKAYRGQGLGWQMVQQLFDFAQKAGYRAVRLDLANEERQLQALKFYQTLGFYRIGRYNDSDCTVFMEKII
jgi:putative acetyltransferase